MRRFTQSSFLFRVPMIICILTFSLAAAAQDKVEMADSMRSNGKIYVVVAVCVTILVGLFVYVFALDRKISRMEKRAE